MSRVVVVEADPAWPTAFEALRRKVATAVQDAAVAIEHVGSTSVPGLAAKPILDVDVVVRRDRLAEVIERLEAAGYEHRGNLGIPDREAFHPPPASASRHNLYLCPEDSPALANHLAVRDYLRAHPAAAAEYGELKKRLALRFAGDIDGYVEGKTAFLTGILRECGFAAEEIADIERINRRPGPSAEGP